MAIAFQKTTTNHPFSQPLTSQGMAPVITMANIASDTSADDFHGLRGGGKGSLYADHKAERFNAIYDNHEFCLSRRNAHLCRLGHGGPVKPF